MEESRRTGEYANGTIYDGWCKADGKMNYPPNNGAIPGTEQIVSLGKENTISVGRYGVPSETSAYVTETGASPSRL